jgi:hypothetical protein
MTGGNVRRRNAHGRGGSRTTIARLRQEAKKRIERLSPQRLKVAADFLSYLEERETNPATEELLRIPGFVGLLRRAERQVSGGRVTSWRQVRRDA